MERFKDWLRRLFGYRKDSSDNNYVNVNAKDSGPTGAPPQTDKRSWLARWTPGAQRERQIAWLQAGYSEMLDLMRGIHSHLARQEDVQHKLVAALEQLPASLENLKNLGAAAEQQVEALSLLREQLARSVQHDQQLADSMDRFNNTLGLLDQTARASGRTVEELVQQAREEDRLLHQLVQRSERRFMLVTALFVVAMALFMGASGYVFNRTRAVATPPSGEAAALPQVSSPAPAAFPVSEPAPPATPPVTPAENTEAEVEAVEPSASADEQMDTSPANPPAKEDVSPRTGMSEKTKKKTKRSWFRRRPKTKAVTADKAAAPDQEGTAP